MPKITYIFLDTNIALHFKRPSDIDWPSLVTADQVVLVAAPVFTRELELNKIHNQSKKLRERAADYIHWLSGYIRKPEREVRTGVSWHFIANEPQIDFSKHKLSPSIADDNLIASVLCFQQKPISVATGDIGFEVKLLHRNIDVLTLPDRERLPPATDSRDKELRQA